MALKMTVLLTLLATTSALVIRTPTRSRTLSPHMNFLSQMVTKLQAGQYDEAQVRADVQRMIDRKPCVMFSLTTCSFCKDTKAILSNMGVMYTCLDLDEEEGGMAMKAELANILGGRTSLPAVFAGGEFLGGCNDGGLGGVATLDKSGELPSLLQKAGALSPTQRI